MTPPVERLSCAPEPLVPATLTDATVASYIVDLRGAGQSCRAAISWLKDWAASVNKDSH